jgi:sugar/nucleoside kinase (ribokinase family)
MDLEAAATRAVAAASLAVTRAGAREGLPTTAELDSAIARFAKAGAKTSRRHP